MSEFISMREASKLLPGRPSPTALSVWTSIGCSPGKGERVVLQTLRLGRRVFTKREWIDEFVKSLDRAASAAVAERTRPVESKFVPHDRAAAALASALK